MGTFAVAALIVAVLFIDRFGSSEDLKRRFYQVGLAAALALFAVAIAAVVAPIPRDVSPSLAIGDESGTGVMRERLSVVAGAGFLVLLGSLYFSRLLATITIGSMLGGLVLLISSFSDTSGGLISSYYEIALDGGEARNAAYAGVTGVGLALLLLYGYNEWDKPQAVGDLDVEEA
jgi:hypothetical protein